MKKEIYLSRNLLETIAYNYNELSNPMENLSDYDYIKSENKNVAYYGEHRDDITFYALENIKSAYDQTEQIFDEISMLESANEIEYYLYSAFGENAKTYNIFNNYMNGKETLTKRKMFWLVLDNMNN